jgi:hypothetical protein
MPIRAYLDGHQFDAETTRVMGIAFELACVALKLADRKDLATEMVAKRIIVLATAGERDPDRLCDGALIGLRSPPPSA